MCTNRFLLVVMLLILRVLPSHAQQITWYEHVEPIIVKNCTPCHRPRQSAPFSLTTYKEVANRSEFIAYVTKIGYMPPWRADRTFQKYKNERGLTTEEIAIIQQWVEMGCLVILHSIIRRVWQRSWAGTPTSS